MAYYLSAKEFRQRIPKISEDLKRWGEIIVLKKSKPQLKEKGKGFIAKQKSAEKHTSFNKRLFP